MKQSEIEQLLPAVMQRTLRQGNLLDVLLRIMEELHEPAEDVLQELDRYFDPYRAPAHFVPFLARWVDLGWLLPEAVPGRAQPRGFPTGLGRLRELIAAAARLSQWRGTSRGLQAFLEIATGFQGFTIDEQVPDEDAGASGRPRPFHIRIWAPARAQQYAGLIRRIVEAEKPAYVTYELAFEPEQ